jgi:hypothetical protein
MISLDDVKDEVVNVALSDDNEMAHAREDRLYLDVLKAIAGGCKNPEELAQAALLTQKVNFPRGYYGYRI